MKYLLFFCLLTKVVYTKDKMESFERYVQKYQTNYIPIPKTIWQTYKSKNLPSDCIRCQNTWKKFNPSFEIKLLDDTDISDYIKNSWDERMLKFFYALPVGVMKADLWRYLILATEGGIYSDLDSTSLRPIELWPVGDVQINEDQDYLLIALENNHHFCQWTIASTKNHPAMHYICNYILDNFEKNGIDVKNPFFVHGSTGPGIWTGAICSFLGEEEGTSSFAIFKKYIQDPSYKAYVNSLGIYFYDQKFFSGICTRNLYGSQHFKDGYVSWTEQVKGLNNK
jgi:alpha 1,6-mannosyltransferase